MDVSKISTGKSPPHDLNVVIEIPQGSQVKYEIEKESGAIFVDRFLFTPMATPRTRWCSPPQPSCPAP